MLRLLQVGRMINKFGSSSRFCRPLIGIVVAYAVATQSLLIALGGFALPTHANDSAPAFELCHDSQGAQELPADNADHSACNHSILCFSGSHHAVNGALLVAFHRVDIEILVSLSTADESSGPSAPAHSIASPRGPPLAA
jgi:hypothetical protein